MAYKKYLVIILILFFAVFIGGIILGYAFPLRENKSLDDGFRYSINVFNSNIAYIVWGCDIVITFFLLLINSILKVLEEIKAKL